MNFEIKQDGTHVEITLGEGISIRDAAEFHGAIRVAVTNGGQICIRAEAVKSIHSSIFQILLSLRQGTEDLYVKDPSSAFAAAEQLLGVQFKRAM